MRKANAKEKIGNYLNSDILTPKSVVFWLSDWVSAWLETALRYDWVGCQPVRELSRLRCFVGSCQSDNEPGESNESGQQ